MQVPLIPFWARLAAFVALLIAWPALGAPPLHINSGVTDSTNTHLILIASKCGRISKKLGREILSNSCSQCRIIQVQRKRPGAAAPISRVLTVAPRTHTELSFRGPGQSRIMSDRPCKGADQGPQTSTPAEDGKSCIQMRRTQTAGKVGLELLNTCNACRTAVIERIDSKGGRRSQNIVIASRSAIALQALGAAGARILSEKPCR